jgi:hypothetical protein
LQNPKTVSLTDGFLHIYKFIFQKGKETNEKTNLIHPVYADDLAFVSRLVFRYGGTIGKRNEYGKVFRYPFQRFVDHVP